MRDFREGPSDAAGFFDAVGFNDDTRALLSIPARDDVTRRIGCGFLARLVADHRLDEDEAREVAVDLAYRLAKRAHPLGLPPHGERHTTKGPGRGREENT